MTQHNRANLLNNFIQDNGWDNATRLPLIADASTRQYIRLSQNDSRAMLMDAPPPKENVRAFVNIGRHLQALGFSTPRILAQNLEEGFLLLEDFGDDTFTTLLKQGYDESHLYKTGIDLLVALHTNSEAANVKAPLYSNQVIISEADRFIDWYFPEARGRECNDEERDSFRNAWQTILDGLQKQQPTLVLRDFHVDNLMKIDTDICVSSCGLLDFQDSLIGSPAYDVVSFLEDARRNVNAELQLKMLDRYFAANPTINRDDFMQWYVVLGAQRHTKVIGLFTRLMRQDDKPVYLPHLPRVMEYFDQHLKAPVMAPVKEWLKQYLPNFREIPKDLVV